MEKTELLEAARPHVALYPAVGMGHLIPFLEFANSLVSVHGFAVTLITTTWKVSPLQTAYINNVVSSNPHTVHHLLLPEISLSEEKAISLGQYFVPYVDKSMGALEEKLKMLQEPGQNFSPVCAFITDLFHLATLDVTNRLGIPNYIFFTTSAAFLCLMLYAPELVSLLDANGNGDEDSTYFIPCLSRPLRKAELPQPFNDRTHPMFSSFLRICPRLQEVRGILLNTFQDLEAETLDALLAGQVVESERKPLICAVGPVFRSFDVADPREVDAEKEARFLMTWLDAQPDSSVLYLSFGSFGLLSDEQIREIALGLEGSGQRFVLVLRGSRPKSNEKAQQQFGAPELEVSSVLPEGFESRVEGRGRVVSTWAPQIEILGHRAVGGFVSHCGWNSTLEGIWHGVPIVAWPLYAEQHMNCGFIVEEWKVGLEVKKTRDGMVKREEVESVVKELMEGEEGRRVRNSMEDLSAKARSAVEKTEGRSFKSLEVALRGLVEGAEIDNQS